MGETDSERLGRETLRGIVDRLEEGDEFQVHAGEFIVDEVVDCEARPMVRIRKKSVSGYMEQTYRLEWADPTDEDDETLVIKTRYKSHWSEWSTFAPEKLELDDEDKAEGEPAEKVLMTDGGIEPGGCQLCEPAPHPNCEVYTQVTISDPMDESEAAVDVCLEHFEAIEEVL